MSTKEQLDIEKQIDETVGEVRTDALDFTFSEISNLHKQGELVIHPDFQRLFRWSDQQQSRLIESIILELPLPQITVIENEEGIFELVDGLQRISSVLRFLDPKLVNKEELVLSGCDLVGALNGKKFTDLPLRLQLRIKRSGIRTIVIKRQSKPLLRYEMFNRLNTGGEAASPQEIRNCTARMLGESGISFYKFLQDQAKYPHFIKTIEPLPDEVKQRKGDEELVLRFFAAKNAPDLFKGSVEDWLTSYMTEVTLGRMPFDYAAEKKQFEDLFEILALKLGDGAFTRYRGGQPFGALAPAYFEAVSIGTFSNLAKATGLDEQSLKKAISDTVAGDEFRSATGPGANSKEKLRKRMSLISDAIVSA